MIADNIITITIEVVLIMSMLISSTILVNWIIIFNLKKVSSNIKRSEKDKF